MLIHTAHDLFLVDALEPSVPRVTLADQVAETLGEPLPTPQLSTSTTSTTTSAVAALAAAGRKVQGADYNDDDDDDDSSLDDDEGWDDDLDGMESTSVDAKKVNSWQQGTSSTVQYTKHRCAMDASSHSILAFVFFFPSSSSLPQYVKLSRALQPPTVAFRCAAQAARELGCNALASPCLFTFFFLRWALYEQCTSCVPFHTPIYLAGDDFKHGSIS